MNRRLLGGLLILVAFGIAILVVRPKAEAVRSDSITQKVKLEQVKKKEARRDALRTLSQTVAKNPQKVEQVISVLPPEPQIPEVLVSLEAISQDSGLKLSSIIPQDNTSQRVVSVSLSGEGDLGTLERVMQAISDNDRPMSIVNVNLNRKEGTILTINLNVAVPYAGKAATPAAAAASDDSD